MPGWSKHAGRYHVPVSARQFRFAVLVLTLLAWVIVGWSALGSSFAGYLVSGYALAMLVKEALGQDWLDARQTELRARALKVWERNDRIELLGVPDAEALPIFSFRVRDGQGGLMHHQFFTRLLSDLTGVQARGGCACAGPYGHRLLGLGRAESDATIAALEQGRETDKPGWVRLNLSALMSDKKADLIIGAVDNLARIAPDYAVQYRVDTSTARFNAEGFSKDTLAS